MERIVGFFKLRDLTGFPPEADKHKPVRSDFLELYLSSFLVYGEILFPEEEV
jgi:hypothetical protein